MAIRALQAPDDVARYRNIRLRALQTDPAAFGSTFEAERAFDTETWHRRMTTFLDRPAVVFADDAGDGHLVAIGGIGRLDATTAIVWGMWVAPEARRRGSARRIIDAALAWAEARSVTRVVLDVKRDNRPAIDLYRSIGFTEGVHRPDPDGPCRDELSLELALDVSAPGAAADATGR